MSEKLPTRAPQDADKYVVRFPEGMRDAIAEAAKGNSRSMNAEIVARLERSLYPASDEESAMAAMRTLMEHGKKYEMDVSISMSRTSEKLLELAIKNGSLPPDATLEDLKNPGPAIERMAASKAAKGSSKSEDPSPPQRKLNLSRSKKTP